MLDNKIRFNNKGFTIAEALVGIGLLGIVMVVGTQGYDYVKKSSVQISTMNTTENRVNEIIQTIKSNISQQIVSFPASVDTAVSQTQQQVTAANPTTSSDIMVASYIDTALAPASLPMAWSINSDSEIAACANCPGRYGYTITAIPNYGGLYKVTIKFTHTDWGTTPKVYNFVVSK